MQVQRGIQDITLAICPKTARLLYGTGQAIASPWKDSLEELFRSPWFMGAENIRVLGSRGHAELICKLYEYKAQASAPYRILLGSEMLVKTDKDIGDTFQQMLELSAPSSVGGWHEMTTHDYTIYRMISSLHEAQGRVTNLVHLLYKAHPAFPALSFIPTLNENSAALLLGVITDPRFRMNPKWPDRMARLRTYLGIDEARGVRHARAFLAGVRIPGDKAVRASMLFDCWANEFLAIRHSDRISARDFLHRVTFNKKMDDATALLRSSQVFIRFLVSVWLDNLTPARLYNPRGRIIQREGQGYCPTLFVPEHFFKHPDEVEAWQAHKMTLRNRS